MLAVARGPAQVTFATTCTPGRWHIHKRIAAISVFPMNLGFLGKAT